MDQVDAEIAVLMRERDAASVPGSGRVEKALRRLRESQTFSRLEAADREIDRAMEEQEFLLMAIAIAE